MTPPRDQHLTLSDLRLLMDNYQNIIQMNTILLEQQKQVIDLQKIIFQKEDDICKSQAEITNTLKVTVDNLSDISSSMKDLNEELKDISVKINNSFSKEFDNVGGKIDSMTLDNTKSHGKLTNKLYIAMSGSFLLIGSLVAIIITLLEKNKITSSIITILNDILTKLKAI